MQILSINVAVSLVICVGLVIHSMMKLSSIFSKIAEFFHVSDVSIGLNYDPCLSQSLYICASLMYY